MLESEPVQIIDPIDEDDEDYDDYDDIIEGESWEDDKFPLTVMAKYPDWHSIQITNYSSNKIRNIDEWCIKNATGKYERVGWGSSCAYSVGMVFEEFNDAVMFKLRWR